MPPLISQLELIMRQLLSEHATLLKAMALQEAALKSMNLDAIDRATRDVESVRNNIAQLETRRRQTTVQIQRQSRHGSTLTLLKLAELNPDRKLMLLQLRTELIAIINQVRDRARQLGKITAGVLGHLNAAVRIVADAASGPGTYDRPGVTQMSRRVGILNAVG